MFRAWHMCATGMCIQERFEIEKFGVFSKNESPGIASKTQHE